MTTEKNMAANMWDVVVVGAGHAGCEAAMAAARLGCATLLLNSGRNTVALMPCNPSVGGLAKSHLVYELDALGGAIGFVADCTGIQFRTLNASRGPAVQATRSQNDKRAYAQVMRWLAQNTPNLTLLEDVEVTAVLLRPGRSDEVCGVQTSRLGAIYGKTVVITAGTALNGTIHVGRETRPGGGDGRTAAAALSASLRSLGLDSFRLKTGTPPRLAADSIDFDATTCQPGEPQPPLFSWLGQRLAGADCSTWNSILALTSEPNWQLAPLATGGNIRSRREETPPGRENRPSERHCSMWNIGRDSVMAGAPQIACWSTATTAATHKIIADNLRQSSLYGGEISGTGVRYCPSIEDKIVKFADREHHHVFLEPEGRAPQAMIYPNGLSNSLPRDIQEQMVRSVPGLERARFLAYAYAIEYDCFNALDLHYTLECHKIANLYLAGQINGTTGYEEAAALGFMAGVNAALRVKGEAPFILSRQESYIGVMIDDLVTRGTNEPYRMFTSRAERRLLLRQDNARFRLLPHARRLGIAPEACLAESAALAAQIDAERLRLQKVRLTDGTPLERYLARPEVRYADIVALGLAQPALASIAMAQVELEVKYAGYIEQERRQAERARQMEAEPIPPWVDYWRINALRYECREKLSRIRPISLGQAARVPGMTPADIAVLSVVIKRGKI